MTEIFCLKLVDLEVVDKFHRLIRPPISIPEECVKITGITDKMVKDAPSFAEVYPALAEFCVGGYRWVAHNLQFDKGMLLAELGRLGKRANFPWPVEDYCTVEHSLQYSKETRRDGQPKYLKLTELHKIATGEPHDEGAHRAEADVMALYRCYKWLVRQ